MNEGDSAGGGHQGRSPAPPAVPDPRSVLSTTYKQTPNAIASATANATNLNTTPPLNDSQAVNRASSTSNRSFQQTFNQKQPELHSPKQQHQITSISSGSTVITSLSAASNQLQHHMQQDSTYYVADVAETTNLSNTQQKPDRILVTQAQPTKSSYLETPSTSEIPSLQAKRFKIDTATTDNVLGRSGVVTGSLLPTISFRNERPASVISTVSQDISTLKKLIIEKKYLRLKSIKEEHYDNVAELFYLQSGGNMMDYPAWKKKPPCPQFVKVSNAYRLDHLVNEEVTSAAATPTIALPPHAAENIATVIGVSSSPSVKQQPAQAELIKTNTQPKLSPLPTTGQSGLKRKRSSSTPPNVPNVTSSIPARKGSGLPQGAEIKIPAVGATPVAVSTQLPAAVVQLTQQGGTPLVPCCSGTVPVGLRRNGNNDVDEVSTVPNGVGIQTAIAAVSKPVFTSSDSGGVSQAAAKPGNGSNSCHSQGDASMSAGHSNSVQEFSFKAKQEVYVMQRISELQREGLWTEKRLPKLQEPSRPKAHWDYLLEEMVWLAADFAQERKWKKNAAKKCARMVQKYFQDKANAAQKAEKAQELHLKRIASFISKEVKIFWSNVEKLVEYKHHTKIEEKRKKALDQHLSFIVDQTEKFSQQLAEGMSKSITDPAAVTSAAPSINSSRLSSPKKEETNMSDDEFRPVSSSEDDEETIAKADEEAVDVNAEVVALEKESQMDLDDFINNLPAGYLANRDNLVLEEKFKAGDAEEETDDSEFQVNEASDDDEITISQQEAEESELDYKKELDELEADNDLTVEELMEKYRAKQQTNEKLSSKSSDAEIDSDDDDDNELDSDDASSVVSENSTNNDTEDETVTASDAGENDKEDGLESLFNDNDRNKDSMINDAAAIAESIQPKGNTLSSTNVVTPVPFLLKHTLREYQHIGLDWLVTMHDRKLNGILADEMGLGKTIQTIALLAHLACVKGNWGPHLIVVPSSVMLNWEMEFKKWCPGFKILTYYGTQKERKLKRVGWTKPNAFHVCITSYKLVTQDQQSFRRKKWKYLILDEAQNIKNFKSQRWQLLLNFSTERRLLLTGTPLQNDLMELWSLMHFLMPYVFSSHREFKEWFSNPMTGMIEGNMEYNESLINRLHKVIRPFLLRRLKKEVEKQMPKKYEHVVMCRLSNRQRYLYDDFMSRAKTKETLQSGNLLSVINILMQLRKVCNHPNMFEVRPTISPFQMEGISYQTPRLVCDILDYDPIKHISLESLNLCLIQLELTLTAYVSYKSRQLAPPRKLIEEIDTLPDTPPRCPSGRYKFHIRVRDPKVQRELSTHSASNVQVGASPAMKMEGNKFVPLHSLDKGSNRIKSRMNSSINPISSSKSDNSALITTTPTPKLTPISNVSLTAHSGQLILGTRNVVNPSGEAVTTLHSTSTTASTTTSAKIAKLVQSGKPYFLLTSAGTGGGEAGGGRLTLVCKTPSSTANMNKSDGIAGSEYSASLVTALAQKVKTATELTEMKSSSKLEKKMKSEDDASSELDPIYNISEVMQKRKEWRLGNLKFLSLINKRRSEAVPIYGSDCRETLEKCTTPTKVIQFSNWHTRGYTNCRTAMGRNDSWTLSKLLKSYERRCEELRHTFANFVIYVPAVSAPTTRFYTQNLCSNRVQRQSLIENTITRELSPKLTLLHPIISAMTTKFPDPRLIQYDCGKLQTLDLLLRQLKRDKHRVLIFTQMTKMLDILEAFLNYHGHIYLRLDGSTRVEQRQALMERFNADKRMFCFILSTRSGGVGINLTGADTVIFYDSDWNPTMDAQAQDRCHRIGQTRDVHIYRLVSEKTIEVNILKKANQKRMLSDMAIEGGNFTTSFLKSSTIKDLFNMDNQERELDTANCVRAEKMCASNERSAEVEMEKQSLRAFESALAAAEDEQDVQATSIAKAEVAADLAEFDENILIDDTIADNANTAEMSKADLEVLNLVKQLSPIERYAMRFVEETGAAWTAEQLRAAEEELEAQKREWEANRQAALLKEEEMLKQEAMAEETITYSRKDATNQVWISDNTMEQMPIWCPPTPPQNDNDIYIDYSLSYMYETTIIPDADLPPVYTRKDYKRSRFEAGFAMDGSRRPSKIRKEDNFFAPRSLFDRPSPAIAKIRRDLKLQRYRGVFKPNVQIPGLKIQAPQKPQNEPEGIGDWTVYEDFAMVYVLSNMQGLPCNLMPLSPGHTANWDLVAEIVNLNSKTYRSPKQCRWRYETIVLPREEGKLVESPKKHKKIKTAMKSVIKGPVRSLKTAQMYASDNNMSFIKMMRARFDAIKTALLKKAPPPKRHYGAPSPMNPKHAEVLQEFGISNYDQPISPLNIAIMKANKMREKQRCHLPPQQSPVVGSSSTQQQQLTPQPHQELKQNIVAPATNTQVAATTQQIQIQQSPSASQQAAATAIVMPQSTQHQQLPQLIQSSAQGQAVLRSSSGAHQTATQIVKAIVTPQSGILAGQVQQLTQQSSVAPQQLQLQSTSSGSIVGAPASVSVVLSTPVQTMSSNIQPHSGSQPSAQIISVTPQNIVSSASQMGSLVQTITSQSIPQVVSVSQLATVGTVLTTSTNIQPHTTVTTLNTSALRAQRIVAASSGALQDVVLQQRPSNQSPTIVSMAALGQTVTPAQFQTAQLRLASMPGGTQHVVAKGIPVGSLQQSGKIATAGINQPTQIQLYRQRQQLKVLQAGQGGQAVVQTVSGQTALVNSAGAIIQGTIGSGAVQVQQGQKVAVATVSGASAANTSGGSVTPVATVQVAHNQGRAQFIKQVAAKQAIARQVADNEMLLVKRQVIGSHQKAQVLQQGQIFAATSVGSNIQMQQQQQQQQQQSAVLSSGNGSMQQQQVSHQQIATLVKTSSGTVSSASSGQAIAIATAQQPGTVNMALSHIKPGGQIKVTMANQSQMRQLHMQHQHLAIGQPRKISKMTQLGAAQASVVGASQHQTCVSSGQQVQVTVSGSTTVQKTAGTGNVQTQLVHIQNPKSLPASVTVQQIQQVMRQGQQGTLSAAGLVLGKTSVGRVIPVSVASQPNPRQTIQVVSAASAQAIASGNLRAHVASGQNITGTIKVTGASQSQGQNQQALITAIQQQTAVQQGQRQNASPVRLQTTIGGNLVAVVQQQQQQHAGQHGSSTSGSAQSSIVSSSTLTQTDALTITQASSADTSIQLSTQVTTPQQVRTLVKKKIMQIRSEKD